MIALKRQFDLFDTYHHRALCEYVELRIVLAILAHRGASLLQNKSLLIGLGSELLLCEKKRSLVQSQYSQSQGSSLFFLERGAQNECRSTFAR